MSYLTPTYSNAIVFTKDLTTALGKLGYKSTNLEEFLLEMVKKESLAEKVAALETAVKGISADTLSSNAKSYGLKTGAADVVKIANRSVEYSVENQQLTYDFSKLTKELPQGIVYLGSRVDVVDDRGKRASIKGKNNTLALSGPATATFSIDLKSANGSLTLEKAVRLDGNTSSNLLLNERDFTTGEGDLTIKEHIERLSATVALLNQRI
jgi:hypothetical protein